MVQTIKARRSLQSVKAPPANSDDSPRASSSLARDGDLPPHSPPSGAAAISTSGAARAVQAGARQFAHGRFESGPLTSSQSRMHRSWGRAMFEDHAPLVVGPAPKDDADSPLILLWLAWTTLSPYQRLGIALVAFACALALGTLIAWAGGFVR